MRKKIDNSRPDPVLPVALNAKKMERYQARYTYLDNIRNILVYNVVFVHIICVFGYPLMFWWSSIDKNGSSRVYENLLITMDIYLMPLLIFIAALFIFPSLNAKTTLGYIKKRFFRLCVPLIVFIFCAGDFFYQVLLKRLGNHDPSYLRTFPDFWRDFKNFSVISFIGEGKMLNEVRFTLSHLWFLAFLFFMTLLVVLVAIPFRKKGERRRKVDSRKKIIIKTCMLAVTLSLFYAAASIFFPLKGIRFDSWIRLFGLIQVRISQFWMLLPLFLFGLHMYRKNWLTRGDIGSWKMWGLLSAVSVFLFALLIHNGLLPTLDELHKVAEHNYIFADKVPFPIIPASFKLSWLIMSLLQLPIALFLLMFFLSFAKRFFNKTNKITEFCSKHSINVYILHFIPVIILQYSLVSIPVAPIVKAVAIIIIVIPACLWLSHYLVYPYPLVAISFFIALKLASLVLGFNFYYIALLTLLLVSFAGALYESARLLVSVKTPSP